MTEAQFQALAQNLQTDPTLMPGVPGIGVQSAH
jgi:hypothetical protein